MLDCSPSIIQFIAVVVNTILPFWVFFVKKNVILFVNILLFFEGSMSDLKFVGEKGRVRCTPAELDHVVRLKLRAWSDEKVAKSLGKSRTWVKYLKVTDVYQARYEMYCDVVDALSPFLRG